jgi:streptogramin lyase
VRIDPRTLRVTGSVPAPKVQGSGDQSGALAVGEGAVWWNGANSGTVWRVNPKTQKIDATARITPPLESFSDFLPFGIAAGAGGVWVTVTIAP